MDARWADGEGGGLQGPGTPQQHAPQGLLGRRLPAGGWDRNGHLSLLTSGHGSPRPPRGLWWREGLTELRRPPPGGGAPAEGTQGLCGDRSAPGFSARAPGSEPLSLALFRAGSGKADTGDPPATVQSEMLGWAPGCCHRGAWSWSRARAWGPRGGAAAAHHTDPWRRAERGEREVETVARETVGISQSAEATRLGGGWRSARRCCPLVANGGADSPAPTAVVPVFWGPGCCCRADLRGLAG